METTDDGIPVVYGVRFGGYEGEETERLIILKCPFCGHRHVHGQDEGHRVPHCHPDKAPPEGYLLKEREPGRPPIMIPRD